MRWCWSTSTSVSAPPLHALSGHKQLYPPPTWATDELVGAEEYRVLVSQGAAPRRGAHAEGHEGACGGSGHRGVSGSVPVGRTSVCLCLCMQSRCWCTYGHQWPPVGHQRVVRGTQDTGACGGRTRCDARRKRMLRSRGHGPEYPSERCMGIGLSAQGPGRCVQAREAGAGGQPPGAGCAGPLRPSTGRPPASHPATHAPAAA
jgi:hypothetical protein